MNDIWIAVVIGIVEGLTEFLPVSSTGHMILTGHLIGFKGERADSFEIVIQLGAILAVMVLYWRKIIRLFGFQPKEKQLSSQLSLIHIAIAIIPAMGLAYLGKDFIKGVLFSAETVLIGLVVGGVFLIIAEKQKPVLQTLDIDQLTYKQVFYIGMAQCLSLWPGFSRSGATIAGGMLAGATRGAAAEFSFLIAVPVMIIVTSYEMLQSYHLFSGNDFYFLATGFVVSFIVALIAVVTFIKLVQKLSLIYFAYYRFALALVFLLYILVSGS